MEALSSLNTMAEEAKIWTPHTAALLSHLNVLVLYSGT